MSYELPDTFNISQIAMDISSRENQIDLGQNPNFSTF